MSEGVKFLREYRSSMDIACEAMAVKLGEMGLDRSMTDDELVHFATRKLGTLYGMLKAAGLPEGVLRAIIAE